MTQWTAFAGFIVLLTGIVLALAHASHSVISEEFDRRRNGASGEIQDVEPHRIDGERDRNRTDTNRDESADVDLSTGWILTNVALSQGLLAALLIGAIWVAGIPLDSLGLAETSIDGQGAIVLGIAAGVVLYIAAELGAVVSVRLGLERDESLREWLAPDGVGGWLLLLVGVLPIIAVFEELLFRAALIGAISAGFDLSPWILAVLSSGAFAFGHGAQGRAGIIVTGLLGLLLAAAFIWTGSLLVVIVAHYVVNALEFGIHEGLGIDWAT